jgi:hypothetical protein
MAQKRRTVSFGFPPESYPEGTHMCYIFNDESQRRDVIAAFLGSGLSEKEKVGYFADSATPEEALSFLRKLGVKIPNRTAPDAFSVSKAGLFDGGTLFDVLSVHPNFIHQAEFLKKWHERARP